MTTQATTRKTGKNSRTRSAVLLTLALGAVLAALVALTGAAQQAEAASSERIVFTSNRTGGTGVNNPTGDYEIFRMNPDGTGLKQLTTNKGDDFNPTLSPDGTNIAYRSVGIQTSNPEGDNEVYVMNTVDGSGKKNLTNNDADINDASAVFSPGGKKIAYTSEGVQTSNPGGDYEVYRMNALDGTGQTNLSNNGSGVIDIGSAFSADGTRVVYQSYGKQTSNPEGEWEIYRKNTVDGKDMKNLTDNRADDGLRVGLGAE